MNLSRLIAAAFDHRERPADTTFRTAPQTGDVADAEWFAGREWAQISWEDWTNHVGAFYTFTPTAFTYYLPSILILSADRPREWFSPADALLQILDRSAEVRYWDNFLITRLIGLKADEYLALKSWVLHLSADSAYLDQVDRAFDTLNLLEQEIERSRNLVRRTEQGK